MEGLTIDDVLRKLKSVDDTMDEYYLYDDAIQSAIELLESIKARKT